MFNISSVDPSVKLIKQTYATQIMYAVNLKFVHLSYLTQVLYTVEKLHPHQFKEGSLKGTVQEK